MSGSVLLSKALNQRLTFSMAKSEKTSYNKQTHLALKWATSNYTMLGIKAESVNFPLREKNIGKKQVIVMSSDYQHCSSSMSHVDTDQILQL